MKAALIIATMFVLRFIAHAQVTVHLSDFGGMPGSTPEQLSSAFQEAFADLKSHGGGELVIDPGNYDFGNLTGFTTAVLVYDLRNVTISGYGASLRMRTIGKTPTSTPTFFRFQNPDNVTIKGLSFTDLGANLSVNWFGALCIVLGSTERHSGFTVRDCVAENVVTFFTSQESGASQYTFERVNIQATVRNAYYGVNANYNCRYSSCNLICMNVRRAFIAYGPLDWNVVVRGTADGVALGSNGFIELVPEASNVENVTVDLAMSGNLANYLGMVHFYNQGPLENPVCTANVKVNVKFSNVITGGCNMFIFDHEYPVGTVNAASPRAYRQVVLRGSVSGGSFTSKVIHHPTISTGSGNSILVSATLAALQNNLLGLPRYFRIVK